MRWMLSSSFCRWRNRLSEVRTVSFLREFPLNRNFSSPSVPGRLTGLITLSDSMSLCPLSPCLIASSPTHSTFVWLFPIGSACPWDSTAPSPSSGSFFPLNYSALSLTSLMTLTRFHQYCGIWVHLCVLLSLWTHGLWWLYPVHFQTPDKVPHVGPRVPPDQGQEEALLARWRHLAATSQTCLVFLAPHVSSLS